MNVLISPGGWPRSQYGVRLGATFVTRVMVEELQLLITVQMFDLIRTSVGFRLSCVIINNEF